MSFSLPPVKAKPTLENNFEGVSNTTYGVPEHMVTGIADARHALTDSVHPLAGSEKNYYKNRNMMNMTVLRNTQGLHAPMRIAMELKAAKHIGHLPFLPSQNLMLDVLTGRDMTVMPEDIYGTAEFREAMGQPHAMTEKSFGLV